MPKEESEKYVQREREKYDLWHEIRDDLERMAEETTNPLKKELLESAERYAGYEAGTCLNRIEMEEIYLRQEKD